MTEQMNPAKARVIIEEAMLPKVSIEKLLAPLVDANLGLALNQAFSSVHRKSHSPSLSAVSVHPDSFNLFALTCATRKSHSTWVAARLV